MANQKEIQAHYDGIGALHSLRLEDGMRDYTCALFNGNFEKTLDQAQRAKHDWILKGTKFKKGDQVLDIGCGWGQILETVTKEGGSAIGLTLSQHQVTYCKKKGFDVRLQDYKTADVKQLGKFDIIISIGAFEHFCSLEEFNDGKQEEIYKHFFKFCADLLPKGGRLYLQTMTWGDNTPDPNKFSPKASPLSKEATLYRLSKFYPGSWLPEGLNQLVKCSSDYFNFEGSNNGRLDYIETLKRWGLSSKNLLKIDKIFRTLFIASRILVKAAINYDTRVLLSSLKYNDQQRCFINKWMSHERMFFVKK